MNNQSSSIFRIFLGLVLFTMTNNANPQTISTIKSNPSYIWGEGKGETIRLADQAALAELLNQISVSLSNEISTKVVNEQVGTEARSLVEYKNMMKTYSSATLNNTARIIVSEEPNACVFRFVKRSEVDRIFALRLDKIKEMVKIANNAYNRRSIGNALRYYYWANALLQSTRYPNELEVQNLNGEFQKASVWIPKQMNEIFEGLRANILQRSNIGENAYEVQFLYRGHPVADIDYTYFDGVDWSCVNSALDGVGTIELRASYNPQYIQLKYEYQYYGESQSDREVAHVLEAVKEVRFPQSVQNIALECTRNEKVATQQPESCSGISPDVKSAGMDAIDYRQTMQQIIAAIHAKDYASIRSLFTCEGYALFDKLIHYGNARIVGEPVLDFEKLGTDIYCRSIPMSFTFSRERKFMEEVVFVFNAEGLIDNVTFGLGKVSTQDIFKRTDWKPEVKQILINFLENYKTAYALKRMDYIEDVFADDALIITGKVVERMQGNQESGYKQNRFVKLTRQDKNTYMRNLRNVFAGNEFINIKFANNIVKKMGKGGEVYSIQIKQDYFSTNYGDSGYLFVLVDVNDPNKSIIHVRAWQEKPDPDWGILGPEMF